MSFFHRDNLIFNNWKKFPPLDEECKKNHIIALHTISNGTKKAVLAECCTCAYGGNWYYLGEK